MFQEVFQDIEEHHMAIFGRADKLLDPAEGKAEGEGRGRGGGGEEEGRRRGGEGRGRRRGEVRLNGNITAVSKSK